MKKIIKEQLEKVTVMNIDPAKIDKTFIIPKVTVILPNMININEYFNFYLDASLLNPKADYAKLNNGAVPTWQSYKGILIDKKDGMMLINGVGIDSNYNVLPTVAWFGWLPMDRIVILSNYDIIIT